MIRDRLARQSRRGLRDLERIAGGYSHTRRGLVLIASAGLGALATLAPEAARAIDGTWQGPTAEWTTGTNWSSSPTVPDNTARFTNNGAPTSLTISASTSINTMLFTPGGFIYPRQLDSLHHCWRWHRQRFFECPEFLRGAHIDAVVHQ
jgi:hypothetical protein